MEGLKEIIRNIAMILLLASFLEMLLPNKNMRGMIQLVMGLFVIAAIINPLASFLQIDYQTEIPAWFESANREMPVLASDGALENQQEITIQEQYKKILAHEIRVLLSTLEEIREVDIEVILDKKATGRSDYPKIEAIHVWFSKNQGIKQIEPVLIGEEAMQSMTSKETEIQKRIAVYMQLPKEIIHVKDKS